MSYWLVAAPNQGGDALSTLNNASHGLSKNCEFKIPPLKVGTLDSLMSLCDDLGKSDTLLMGLANKIAKTYEDLLKGGEDGDQQDKKPAGEKKQEIAPLKVTVGASNNQVSTREFVERFAWNEVRYPKRSPLRQLTDLIVKDANKSDETLKKQLAEYNEVRTAFSTIERKDTGSLLVKPLSSYVKERDIIEKGHLTTVLVVVPRAKEEEFLSSYELMEDHNKEKEDADRARKEAERKEREAKAADLVEKAAAAEKQHQKPEAKAEDDDLDETAKLEAQILREEAARAKAAVEAAAAEEAKRRKTLPCKIVVPKSARKLCDEAADEFVLYRVIVIREGLDQFKNLCRERRYTVRPFALNATEEKEEREKKVEFAKKKKNLYGYLIRWCSTTYSEIFSGAIHLKAIRLYVEAVLRYGLPVDFKAAIMEPSKSKEKQLRSALKQLYAKLAGSNANVALMDANEVDLSGLGADFYPYVYLPLNLE